MRGDTAGKDPGVGNEFCVLEKQTKRTIFNLKVKAGRKPTKQSPLGQVWGRRAGELTSRSRRWADSTKANKAPLVVRDLVAIQGQEYRNIT